MGGAQPGQWTSCFVGGQKERARRANYVRADARGGALAKRGWARNGYTRKHDDTEHAKPSPDPRTRSYLCFEEGHLVRCENCHVDQQYCDVAVGAGGWMHVQCGRPECQLRQQRDGIPAGARDEEGGTFDSLPARTVTCLGGAHSQVPLLEPLRFARLQHILRLAVGLPTWTQR